jgi:serine/threonine protein kinase
MDRCPELYEIEAYLAGDDDPDESQQIRAHLGRCGSCASRSAKIRSHIHLARQLREALSGSARGDGPQSSRPDRPGSSDLHGAPDRAKASSSPLAERTGVPGYTFIRPISRTLSSMVYEAVQDGTRQRVAIKLLHAAAGADDRARIRFEREIDLLVRLRHPHIVPIYASGVAGGQFYYVMPLIEGLPPDAHIRDRGLPLREAIELLKTICEAVSFAHQRGVLHRDIKPSNILVGADGRPQVLDFGLAKLRPDMNDESLTALTLEQGQIVGTPAYMSPEQASGRNVDVDVRSDVYALGVLMYRSLTGATPYPTDGPLSESLRQIVETPPRRPTTIRPELGREIEAVLLKTLEKEPARRYQSAAALAEDLDRFLTNQPVLAQAPSRAYQFRKLVARHKLPFSLIGAIFLLVTGFAAAVTVQNDRIREESQKQQQVLGFYESGFERLLAPESDAGPDVRLREYFDLLAADIDERFEAEPDVRARMQDFVGVMYKSLGDYRLARENLEAAMDARVALFGEEDLRSAESMHNLAAALWFERDYDRAESLYLKALAIRRQLLGDDHEAVASTLNHLGATYRSLAALREGDERQRCEGLAEQYARESLAIRQRVFGPAHPEVAKSLHNLATILCRHESPRHAEAEPLYREAIELLRASAVPHQWHLAQFLTNLGVCRLDQGAADDATLILEEALKLKQVALVPHHPSVRSSLRALCDAQLAAGRAVDAEATARSWLESEQTAGASAVRQAEAASRLIRSMAAQGRLDEATMLADARLQELADAAPAAIPAVRIVLKATGEALRSAGQEDAAAAYEQRLADLPVE